jgi:hypothetical protein
MILMADFRDASNQLANARRLLDALCYAKRCRFLEYYLGSVVE